MILVSSNEDKIREFRKILGNSLKIEKGKDLKEVDSTIDNVIKYKSLDAGKDRIVEDSVLTIDGKPVVDIRWQKDFQKWYGKPSEFIVSLGYNDGKNIYIYRGILKGKIVEPKIKGGFAFDPYFQPNGSNKTLADKTTKEKYNPRKIAIQNLKNNKYIKKYPVKTIKTWRGRWQND
jgi:inosine/xanthosine triphosphate pyrophosphatase family protein